MNKDNKKKWENINEGFVLIDKVVGKTSFDEVFHTKIKFSQKRVGHIGTLDPFASGLLILALNRYTKLFFLFDDLQKEYIAKGIFGISTDTDDITGNIIKENVILDNPPSRQDFQILLKQKFSGHIKQIPPVYSAKKINGKRAYLLARKGQEISLKPCDVFIENIELLEYDYPNFTIKINVSKGTYIRSIIRDIGTCFNTVATTTELCRTAIGYINLDDVKKYSGSLITIEKLFPNIRIVKIENSNYKSMILNGNKNFFALDDIKKILLPSEINSIKKNERYIFLFDSDNNFLSVLDIINMNYAFVSVLR